CPSDLVAESLDPAVSSTHAGSQAGSQADINGGSRGAPLHYAAKVPTDRRSAGEAAEAKPTPAVGGIPIQIPPLELLDEPAGSLHDREQVLKEHRSRVTQIDETLANFKLGGRVVAAVRGPTVTRFEVEPAPGEKISRFANLSDDLALAMAVGSVRIEAPIPGK